MGEIDDKVAGNVCLEGKRIGDMKGGYFKRAISARLSTMS